MSKVAEPQCIDDSGLIPPPRGFVAPGPSSFRMLFMESMRLNKQLFPNTIYDIHAYGKLFRV